MSFINKEQINEYKSLFCDPSNERLILSIVSKCEESFYSLISKVTEDDFLSVETCTLFSVLKILYKVGLVKFSVVTVLSTIDDLNYSDKCNKDFVESIFSIEVDKINLDMYINKLIDDSTKYRLFINLINYSKIVKENARSISSKSSEDLLSSVQSNLMSLSIGSSVVSDPIHVCDGIDEYIDSIKDVKKDIIGLSTGYPVLDKLIDGQIPGTLMIIAARKKQGKSALLTNIACNVSIMNTVPTLYVDTEMTFKEWRDRVLAIVSGIDERIIKHGGFYNNDKVYKRISEAVTFLKKSKLFHHYMPGYTVDKLSALFSKYKFKENIEYGVFDYIKAPDFDETSVGKKEYMILGDVTTRLKDIAGKLNIPMLAAVQLNRSGDVADSDRISRYGDIVAFWGPRDFKLAEDNDWDLDLVGHYGLRIMDSRRGGRTGEAGIGYKFKKRKLRILEVDITNQVETFDFDEEISI